VDALRRSAWSVALTVGVASLGWLLLLPWDLSVIGLPGANGDVFERDETRFAFIALMVIVAIWCGVLTYIDPEGSLPRGVAAMVTIGLWYLWRASAAHVVDTNVWLSAVIDVILPPTAAAAFVGSALGGLVRRRRRPSEQHEERVSGPEAPR
jgi:hypothetical protein